MSLSRIYEPIELSLGKEFPLSTQAAHHLVRVLRHSINDQLILFNGQGGEYLATILQITKKDVLVRVDSFENRNVESSLNLVLAQGISRGEKMDFTIQKAVELGVKTIVPLFTERCNVRLDKERKEKRVAHWRSIIISACEQSGRNFIPDILEPQDLQTWIKQANVQYGLILSPYADQKLSEQSIPKESVVLLIGPEGGLSEEEVTLATKHKFIPMSLGPRILRTETAAISAMTAIQCTFGDMG